MPKAKNELAIFRKKMKTVKNIINYPKQIA